MGLAIRRRSTRGQDLQYLQNLFADPAASNALAFSDHGTQDGVNLPELRPRVETVGNGWEAGGRHPGHVHGYSYYNRKSWMTETSGENPAWRFPASVFRAAAAWGLALRIHQALATAGRARGCTGRHDGGAVVLRR